MLRPWGWSRQHRALARSLAAVGILARKRPARPSTRSGSRSLERSLARTSTARRHPALLRRRIRDRSASIQGSVLAAVFQAVTTLVRVPAMALIGDRRPADRALSLMIGKREAQASICGSKIPEARPLNIRLSARERATLRKNARATPNRGGVLRLGTALIKQSIVPSASAGRVSAGAVRSPATLKSPNVTSQAAKRHGRHPE